MAFLPPVILGFAALFADTLPEVPVELSAQAAEAYRAGHISQARVLYEQALRCDARHTAALAGLGRIHWMEHRRRSAMQHFARAYQTNPNDPAVVAGYAEAAGDPRLESLLLERLIHLSGTSPEDRAKAAERLALHQRVGDRVINRLVSGYQVYQLSMPLARGSDGRVHGWMLRVSLNGSRPLRLLLDTGSRGVLLYEQQAASLGLEPLAATQIGGFGDGPGQVAQWMLANRAQIGGEVEIANLLVEVGRQRMVEGVDGLIGTDVLRHFLITCDGPKRQMVLTPYGEHSGEEGAGEHPWGRWEAAPVAEGFRPFRRIGHLLVVEDHADTGSHWVIDSGAGYSIAHEEVPSLNSEIVSLVGMSGMVNVHRRPHPLCYNITGSPAWTREVVTTDLTRLSADLGVRIAGFLGFPVLRDKLVTLDARNGALRIGRR